ncbi:sulfotransferase domain-containing protein [Micromonospora sp. CA-111912]|uniref:sulfotransferase domain-containing protein n=1 Tax=Micromonospora sp. CA-111912 TaxID=3239955 RepID=UPI003D90E6DB
MAQAQAPVSREFGQVYAYFGHHKCASLWIRRVFEELSAGLGLKYVAYSSWLVFDPDEKPIDQLYATDFLTAGLSLGARSFAFTDAHPRHVDLFPPGTRSFHVVRDPRDIVVSAYFSHLLSHDIDDFPALARHRKQLAGMPKEQGLYAVMDFLEPMFDDLRQWSQRPDVLEVKLEDLMADEVGGFTGILRFLGLMPQVGTERLAEVLDANSFSRMSGGRTPGVPDNGSHFRKGVAGDWRNHLTDDHLRYFLARHADVLAKYSYL